MSLNSLIRNPHSFFVAKIIFEWQLWSNQLSQDRSRLYSLGSSQEYILMQNTIVGGGGGVPGGKKNKKEKEGKKRKKKKKKEEK